MNERKQERLRRVRGLEGIRPLWLYGNYDGDDLEVYHELRGFCEPNARNLCQQISPGIATFSEDQSGGLAVVQDSQVYS